MKIIEKLKKKKTQRTNADSVTVVCLGDSVTEGCFECFVNAEGGIGTVFDRNKSYAERLKELLARLYPSVQVNVINSGVSGASARDGLKTLSRDVLRFSPDLVIVSYGLNDSCGGLEKLNEYGDTLAEIFKQVTESGAEAILLTENAMCTSVSPHLPEGICREVAQKFAEMQKTGVIEAYFEKAKEVAARFGVAVCDLYSVWKAMIDSGVNVTEILSNKLNHPVREYHYYIAVKIFETMMSC